MAASLVTSAAPALASAATGLASEEARSRLQNFGPNAMPDTALHPLGRALAEFWAPVPWMLEAAILLELVLGKYLEAAVIAALLVFNAGLGFFQEGRARHGEAIAEVTATGARTKFGRSAELRRHACSIL